MLYVFLGGGLGSCLRYAIGLLLSDEGRVFPWATLAANGLSCILLGALFSIADRGGLPHPHRLLFMTGLCGGFSTFSTFTLETFQLAEQGHYAHAAGNVSLSLAICLGCLFLGMKLA
jgi:CrcB protein